MQKTLKNSKEVCSLNVQRKMAIANRLKLTVCLLVDIKEKKSERRDSKATSRQVEIGIKKMSRMIFNMHF